MSRVQKLDHEDRQGVAKNTKKKGSVFTLGHLARPSRALRLRCFAGYPQVNEDDAELVIDRRFRRTK
jgi:hypothetical protein